MKCPECAATFKPWRVDQGFCSTACNKAYNARSLKRSRTLYEALYHWRIDRSTSDHLTFMAREVAAWREEDKAAGRGPPPKPRYDRDRGAQGKTAREAAKPFFDGIGRDLIKAAQEYDPLSNSETHC